MSAVSAAAPRRLCKAEASNWRQNRRIDRFDDVVIETSLLGSPAMLFLAITGYRDDQGRPIPRLGSNAFGYLVPIHSR